MPILVKQQEELLVFHLSEAFTPEPPPNDCQTARRANLQQAVYDVFQGSDSPFAIRRVRIVLDCSGSGNGQRLREVQSLVAELSECGP